MKLRIWEYIIPSMATASLTITCAITSHKKAFWNDELLSFYLLSDSSFKHMMLAWGDTFNQAPPLYFMLGWLWSQIFGITELSLRIFSSFTICIAFTIVWITLRRTYSFWVASIGVLGIFCLSPLIFYHNAEVRMYGLFSAACALGLLQFDNSNRENGDTWQNLIRNTLVHAAIVLTHLYGLFYSGAILVALLLRDRYFSTWRLKLYASVALGWLALVPCIAPLLNQSDNSAKWFSIVSASNLIEYFNPSPKFSFLIVYLVAISIFLNLLNRNYPFINSIQTEAFLAQYPEFLVLNEKDQEWFEVRIENNPNYQIKLLGEVPDGVYGPLEVFHVKRLE